MPTSIIPIAAVLLALLATGCAPVSAIQTPQDPGGPCGALRAGATLLKAQLSSMRTQEQAEADRVYHSVPGITVDSVTQPEMDAMAARIRADWAEREKGIAVKLSSTAARLRRASCQRVDRPAS